MNIGMLNLLHVMPQQNLASGSVSNKSDNSFATMLGSLFQTVSNDVENSLTKSDDLLESLTKLITLLQSDNLVEIDKDSILLTEALVSQTDEELLDAILSFLQLSDAELETSINNLTKSIQNLLVSNNTENVWDSKVPSNEINIDDFSLISDLDGKLEQIIQLLTLASTISPGQFEQIINNDLINVSKVAKLYQLLSSYQDSYESNNKRQFEQLRNVLTELAEQLKSALRGDKQVSRQNYLQKTFSSLINTDTTEQGPSQASNSQVDSGKTLGLINNQMVHIHQMTRAEQLTLMVENNGRQVSPEQLMKQFNSILAKSNFLKEGSTQRLFVKLHPEHLGALRIELVQKNQMMVARILTTTAMAREMLDSQLNNLKQAFVNQNIQVERVEISQQLAQHERFFQREDADSNQQNNHGQEDKHPESNEQDETFGTSFEEALLNVEV